MKPPAVIFDRDGTLFSVACHMGADGPDCWHCYNAGIRFDAPVPVIAGLFHAIRPGVVKIITSGRDGAYRAGMVDSLHKHGIIPDRLLMRAPGDKRRDSIVKLDILDSLILPFYDVRFVVDDRPQVVDAWRSRGLPVLAVSDPGIQPPIAVGG